MTKTHLPHMFILQVNIQYRSDAKQFQLNLGSVGQSPTINPHVIMLTQLQQELNCTRSLAQLAQVNNVDTDSISTRTQLYLLDSSFSFGENM